MSFWSSRPLARATPRLTWGWNACYVRAPVGARVRVSAVRGLTLDVEAVPTKEGAAAAPRSEVT